MCVYCLNQPLVQHCYVRFQYKSYSNFFFVSHIQLNTHSISIQRLTNTPIHISMYATTLAEEYCESLTTAYMYVKNTRTELRSSMCFIYYIWEFLIFFFRFLCFFYLCHAQLIAVYTQIFFRWRLFFVSCSLACTMHVQLKSPSEKYLFVCSQRNYFDFGVVQRNGISGLDCFCSTQSKWKLRYRHRVHAYGQRNFLFN